ncbi:OLC1v1025922C1 [Oldenlandia corymbosa var. corymbosa]|uniref:OLC1v1025922C1 n=1 Tax=Oldenlandia corymbosa var. corymbosa TaxID=529605 RepID=A0AAV1C678_OLDCO|nr:OLC1v1025922C1 [Oldenlandia corymbosa var. corymbosa]
MTSCSKYEIPDEDFYLCHAVDRQLYSRLAINLSRPAEESVHVMAFLMWLQSDICETKGILAKVLEFSDRLFNEIATECVFCLRCVSTDIPPFTEGVYDISLVPRLMGLKKLNLQILHFHRTEVILGVSGFVKDVCTRAFRDIYYNVMTKGKFNASPPADPVTDPRLLFGSENYAKTPIRANDGNSLIMDLSLDIESIFAPSSEDKARHPKLADAGSRVACGYKAGSPGILAKPLKLVHLDAREDLILNELRKIFEPLDRNKFVLNNGDDHHRPVASMPPPPPGPRPLKLLARSYKPYHPRAPPLPPPPASTLGYAMNMIPPPVTTNPPPSGVFSVPPAAQLPEPSWANSSAAQGNANGGYPKYRPPQQPRFVSYDPASGGMNSQYGGGSTNNNDDQTNYVKYNDLDDLLPDDRTVFLTFSKGYPLAASDVSDYFTRKFGPGVIERMYMQIVRPDEQVLYARMVCTSPAAMDLIIQGGKAKYNIHGRHCWARKYIKKIRTLQTAATANSSYLL